MANYSPKSPYFTTTDNGAYLDIINFRNINSLANDVEFEVLKQHEFRPDLLAYDLYGDTRLWWVFAVRNKDILKDPIYDMYAGQKIKIPQIASINLVIGN